MSKYDLSILICSLPNRLEKLKPIIDSLRHQSIGKSVQILYLGDNKSMTVGEKRNKLLDLADGWYITFIDDDDQIKPNYLPRIMEAIKEVPEVITFQVEKFFNGQQDRTQKFSREYGRNHRSPDKKFNLMLPNHLCVWRKDVIKERFPHKNLAEDHQWAEMMLPHYSNEFHIDEVLYTYNFDKSVTETQQ